MFKVSVIVPNYNHAPFLEQRIESILQQTYQHFELIILDDASTDTSFEIIDKYKGHPKVSAVVQNEANSGSTFAQWKKGVHYAKGDLIWIAESDDFADKQFLETLVPAFQNPRTGIAFVHSYDVLGDTLRVQDFFLEPILFENQKYVEFEGKAFIHQYLLYDNRLPNASAVLFRAEALRKIDFSKVVMRVAGDWFVYAEVLAEWDIAISNKCLNYFRFHAHTVRSKKYSASDIEDMIKVLEAMMKTLGIRYADLPNRKNYFLADWYIESFVNTPFFSRNLLRLVLLFLAISKVDKHITKRLILNCVMTNYSKVKKLIDGRK